MNTPNTNIDETTVPDSTASLLSSPGAQEGLEELIEKLEPLLAGRRLNRIVDVLSVVADVVDMTDDYMVEKLCKSYEEVVATAWMAGNITRMASNEVRQMQEPPSSWELLRSAKDPDVRRGMAFMFKVAKGVGKQMGHPLLEND